MPKKGGSGSRKSVRGAVGRRAERVRVGDNGSLAVTTLRRVYLFLWRVRRTSACGELAWIGSSVREPRDRVRHTRSRVSPRGPQEDRDDVA